MALLGAAIVLSVLVTALTGAGLVDLGTHIANVLRSIPLLGIAAGIWPILLGLIGMVVLFALHANGAVGAWDKLDIAERREARRAAPAAVPRDVLRGRFVLYLVACLAVIPLAVLPNPVTAIIALVAGVLAHWPDALAQSLLAAGREVRSARRGRGAAARGRGGPTRSRRGSRHVGRRAHADARA